MRRRERIYPVLRVSDLLNRDSVLLNAAVPGLSDALERLVQLQESNGIITNGTAYYNAVCEREKSGGSTAIGGGMAIPHACSAGVAAPGLAVMTLAEPLDWGAPDARPVDLVFMVAVPPDRQSDRLLILARLVSLLSNESITQALRAAVSREEFIRELAQAEKRIFA